ncbi:tumor necrosis factor receptor superfamily member 6B-like [Lampris incognitus]|uniref:tumor necrosis factor receptor superfamily member 6B-like n=1 Tax=Lampris incognitus TaxID=2546036 RepID=UPI0024B5BBE3|nr:tumor necrosis factor receptor superfamily member 6B-like [Lampris incognitus]
MLFFAVSFAVSFVMMELAYGALQKTPTYQRRDPPSGEQLTCAMCPPGTHMAAHCTATTPTTCAPCPANHFTDLWNYMPKCLYCNLLCGEDEEAERECSPRHNMVCRCKPGYYSNAGICFKHSRCGRGYGVKTNGTSQMNTVCEECPDGYFSNSSSVLKPCVKHRSCTSTGQRPLLSGSAYHDTVCGTCQQLQDGDKMNILREFVPCLFDFTRPRVSKIRRFVTRYTKRKENRRLLGEVIPAKGRGCLLGHIRAWLAKASKDQLQSLPQMLRACQLSALAEKLEKKLMEHTQVVQDCHKNN